MTKQNEPNNCLQIDVDLDQDFKTQDERKSPQALFDLIEVNQTPQFVQGIIPQIPTFDNNNSNSNEEFYENS